MEDDDLGDALRGWLTSVQADYDARRYDPQTRLRRDAGRLRMPGPVTHSHERRMLDELAAMRKALEAANEREATALARADAAEDGRGRRETRMLYVTVGSLIFGAIGAGAAVMAIFL